MVEKTIEGLEKELEKQKKKHEGTRLQCTKYRESNDKRKKQNTIDHEFKKYIKEHNPQLYAMAVKKIEEVDVTTEEEEEEKDWTTKQYREKVCFLTDKEVKNLKTACEKELKERKKL